MKIKELHQMLSKVSPEVRKNVYRHLALQRVLSRKGLVGANDIVSYEELQKISGDQVKVNHQNIVIPAEVVSQNEGCSDFDAIWENSLSVVAETLRKTLDLSDAIDAGLNCFKATDWYNNLTAKKDFDDKYIVHLKAEFEKFEKENDENNI